MWIRKAFQAVWGIQRRWNHRKAVALAAWAVICLVATPAAVADHVDGRDFLVWQRTFGVGPSQNAATVLDNTRCRSVAKVIVQTSDGEGRTIKEAIDLAPGMSMVLPVAVFSSPRLSLRRYFLSQIALGSGPCKAPGAFRAAVLIQNADQTIATSESFPFDAEKNNSSAAGADSISPIGPGQWSEYAVWNGCPTPISVDLEVMDLLTGEKLRSSVDIGPEGFGVIVPVPASSGGLRVIGFGTFEVRRRPGRANGGECAPGLERIVASESLVNGDASTAHASGLPTGKRQHKPVGASSP